MLTLCVVLPLALWRPRRGPELSRNDTTATWGSSPPMKSDTDLSRKIDQRPDYVFKATVKAKRGVVDDVLCRLYLPRTVAERPFLVFEPTVDQIGVTADFEFSFQGRIDKLIIRADRVYSQWSQKTHHAPGLALRTMEAEPFDLKLIQEIGTEQPNAPITNASFWLTPNILLSPDLMIEQSYTGDVKIETVREICFPLPSMRVCFRKYFRYEKSPEGTLSFDELVAEFSGSIERELIEDAVEELDDLLLLTSFGTRHNCVCRGWRLSSEHTDETFYRSAVITPKSRDMTVNDTLIDIAEFEPFLSQTFNVFRASPACEKLRVAINLVLSAEDGRLDSRFLRLFTALETLVSYYRETFGLATVLDEVQWSDFASDLRAFIKQHPLFQESSERRALIYSKLRDLNRIAFGTAFEETASALERQGFDISDLWPVTRRVDGISLTGIRDKMVHGVAFTQPQ